MKDPQLFRRFIRDYWNYYRELEDDFLAVRKFVSFEQANYSTYSIELLKLYQAACSEVDVVGKAMAFRVDSSFKPDDKQNNILKWWNTIQDRYTLSAEPRAQGEKESAVKLLSDASCVFLGDLIIRPWESFRTEFYNDSKERRRVRSIGNSTPGWWSCYNKVKHNRIAPDADNASANYQKANLGNVIQAFAGLYLLETAYMQTIGTNDELKAFRDRSRLFT